MEVKSSLRIQKEKKHYQKVSKEIREEVLDRLLKQKQSITQVAFDLGLKYCTCRTIKKTYESSGRIGKKTTRRTRTQVLNKLEISIQNSPSSFQSFNCAKELTIFTEKQTNNHDNQLIETTHNFLASQINEMLEILNTRKEEDQYNQDQNNSDYKSQLTNAIKHVSDNLQIKIKSNETSEQNNQQSSNSSEQQQNSQQNKLSQAQQQQALNYLAQIQQQNMVMIYQNQVYNNLINNQINILNQMRQTNNKQSDIQIKTEDN